MGYTMNVIHLSHLEVRQDCNTLQCALDPIQEKVEMLSVIGAIVPTINNKDIHGETMKHRQTKKKKKFKNLNQK